MEFRLFVYGLEQTPLPLLPVTLRVSEQSFPATTNGAGMAAWRIVPSESVTVLVQGHTSILELSFPRSVEADTEWAISVPLCNTRPCR